MRIGGGVATRRSRGIYLEALPSRVQPIAKLTNEHGKSEDGHNETEVANGSGHDFELLLQGSVLRQHVQPPRVRSIINSSTISLTRKRVGVEGTSWSFCSRALILPFCECGPTATTSMRPTPSVTGVPEIKKGSFCKTTETRPCEQAL
jgi:hypothetical protein